MQVTGTLGRAKAPLNYDIDDRVFHKKDIPEKALEC